MLRKLLLATLILPTLTTAACLSMPSPREGTRPLRSGEETAKVSQEDTLKVFDEQGNTTLVRYSTSAQLEPTPTDKPADKPAEATSDAPKEDKSPESTSDDASTPADERAPEEPATP